MERKNYNNNNGNADGFNFDFGYDWEEKDDIISIIERIFDNIKDVIKNDKKRKR